MMDALLQDIRYAARRMALSPGFTLVAVLTLALGIGANSAIFSVVNGVLLQPLPYAGAGRLVAIFASERGGTELRNPTSPANFLDWKAESESFEEMTAAHPWAPTLTGGDRPVQLSGLKATPSLFQLLGARPALGQVFTEARQPQEHVVVLSHDLWQREFGGDPGVIGRTVTLDGESYSVLAVMPPGFRFPPFWATDAELWVPLIFSPREASRRSAQFLRVFARLKPDVSLAQAQAEMHAMARRLEVEHPRANAGIGVNVEPLREPVIGGVRPALLVLLGAVGFVLLIACSNVANLLLGRAAARRRETAVRVALGAGRARLIRQWITESLVLALAGGALGLLLALWGVEALVRFGPESLPRLEEIRLDMLVLAFTFGISVLTGVIFGTAPALRGVRFEPAEALRSRHGGEAGRRRLQHSLAGFQIALALVLLIGAGLLLRSFLALQRLDPGFQTENVLTATLSLAGSAHEEPERQNQFFEELVRHLEAQPGVHSAAVINHLPIAGDFWRTPFTIDGETADPQELPEASFRVVSPGYFRTMGIPLLRGRPFGEGDARDAPGAVVVNRTLAARFWPDANPIGQRLRLGGPDSEDPWLTVVGVVGDTKQEALTDAVIPELYLPYSQNPVGWYTGATLVVQHTGGLPGVGAAVREQVWALDRSVPISDLRTMEEILSDHLRRQRLNAALLAIFAGVALSLALVGLYGVISYLVGQRTHEIGVRMALGAAAADVLRMVLRESLLLTGIAIAAGVAGALALTRVLRALLFGVSPTDPLTFAFVALLVGAVALVAALIPALRASRVDPMIALRAE